MSPPCPKFSTGGAAEKLWTRSSGPGIQLANPEGFERSAEHVPCAEELRHFKPSGSIDSIPPFRQNHYTARVGGFLSCHSLLGA